MNIVIIGTGNVATQLGPCLKKAGNKILQVYGRNKKSASVLAQGLKSEPVTDLKEINLTADIYLIAVTDAAIEKIIKKLPLKNQLVVHTSGSVSADVFKSRFKNYGVFYPVQTFSKKPPVNFKITPICLEASNESSLQKLMKLAKSISNNVYVINSEQRGIIHLAAVFVNNFTNHLFTIAKDILKQNNISFDILMPLINQTVLKIADQNPEDVQTGPAIRGDKKIINKHLKMLKKNPKYLKIYKEITKSISK